MVLSGVCCDALGQKCLGARDVQSSPASGTSNAPNYLTLRCAGKSFLLARPNCLLRNTAAAAAGIACTPAGVHVEYR